jgi:hypothetical protein
MYGLHPIQVLPRILGSLADSIKQSIYSSTSKYLFLLFNNLYLKLSSLPSNVFINTFI